MSQCRGKVEKIIFHFKLKNVALLLKNANIPAVNTDVNPRLIYGIYICHVKESDGCIFPDVVND